MFLGVDCHTHSTEILLLQNSEKVYSVTQVAAALKTLSNAPVELRLLVEWNVTVKARCLTQLQSKVMMSTTLQGRLCLDIRVPTIQSHTKEHVLETERNAQLIPIHQLLPDQQLGYQKQVILLWADTLGSMSQSLWKLSGQQNMQARQVIASICSSPALFDEMIANKTNL